MREPSHGPGRRGRHGCAVIGIAAAVLIFASIAAGAKSVAAAADSELEQCLAGHEACRFRSAWARYLPSPRIVRADDVSSARRRAARLRIEVRKSIFTEPGAVYGYPPGNYVVGAYGILYGPYPIRPVRLVYPPVF